MQLAIAIVTTVASIAGLAYKFWKARRDEKNWKAEVDKWTNLAAAATKENIKLRSMLAKKEVALAAAQSALASKMSASELAVALTELFGGKQASPGPTTPAGGSVPSAK